MRINRYLAQEGYATRKGVDLLIERRRVLINGIPAVLGQKVSAEDRIEVNLPTRKAYRYIAYNKPMGIVTHSPKAGEVDALSASGLTGVFPVGRLDKASHGLLILTDDARVTDRLLNPSRAHEKEYVVKTREALRSDFKRRMERGVDIDGYVTKPCTVPEVGQTRFRIILGEGKTHQIRRMCAALSYTVVDLERIRIGTIRLGGLKPGSHRDLSAIERDRFLRTLDLPDR